MDNSNLNLLQMIDEATEFIKSKVRTNAKIALILGSGLNDFANEVKGKSIYFSEIPHFVPSTLPFHKGSLVFGEFADKEIILMYGRLHLYEGFTPFQVTFPIRVLKALGIENLIITNVSGSMNPYFRKKSIMIIDDHINLMGVNPLVGKNYDELGPRFPDMSEPYSKELISLVEQIGLDLKIPLHKGVYVSMLGPSLETRAEYRFLRAIGADVVGMSTVPEVITAVHAGIKVCALSVITDECYPDNLVKLELEDILEIAAEADKKLTKILKELIKRIQI